MGNVEEDLHIVQGHIRALAGQDTDIEVGTVIIGPGFQDAVADGDLGVLHQNGEVFSAAGGEAECMVVQIQGEILVNDKAGRHGAALQKDDPVPGLSRTDGFLQRSLFHLAARAFDGCDGALGHGRNAHHAEAHRQEQEQGNQELSCFHDVSPSFLEYMRE